MILGWSPYQARSATQPSDYLMGVSVEKVVASRRAALERDPIPELLLGDPGRFQAAVRALRSKTVYRAATLTFGPDEIDVAAFNRGDPELRAMIASSIEIFDALFHAGIPDRNRLPFFVGTHTHTGRLEVNFAMPRAIINRTGQVRNFNPHPPMMGSRNDLDAAGDRVIRAFGFRDPRDPAMQVRLKSEDWVEKRCAEAHRAREGFDESDPVPYLFSQLKILSHFYDSIDEVLGAGAFLLEDVGYRVARRSSKTLVLEPRAGTGKRPLELSGSLITGETPETLTRNVPLDTAPQRLSAAWRKRAQANAKGLHIDPCAEPAWDRILASPSVVLPECHPRYRNPRQTLERPKLRRKLAQLVSGLARALQGSLGLRHLIDLMTPSRPVLQDIIATLEAIHVPTPRSPLQPSPPGSDRTPDLAPDAGPGEEIRHGPRRDDPGVRHLERAHSPRTAADRRRPSRSGEDDSSPGADRSTPGSNDRRHGVDEPEHREAPVGDDGPARRLTWWRYVSRDLRAAFPDTDIRILPRPGIGPDALQVRLDGDIFLVDRQGILEGAKDAAFSTVYATLVDELRTQEGLMTDPSPDL